MNTHSEKKVRSTTAPKRNQRFHRSNWKELDSATRRAQLQTLLKAFETPKHKVTTKDK